MLCHEENTPKNITLKQTCLWLPSTVHGRAVVFCPSSSFEEINLSRTKQSSGSPLVSTWCSLPAGAGWATEQLCPGSTWEDRAGNRPWGLECLSVKLSCVQPSAVRLPDRQADFSELCKLCTRGAAGWSPGEAERGCRELSVRICLLPSGVLHYFRLVCIRLSHWHTMHSQEIQAHFGFLLPLFIFSVPTQTLSICKEASCCYLKYCTSPEPRL